MQLPPRRERSLWEQAESIFLTQPPHLDNIPLQLKCSPQSKIPFAQRRRCRPRWNRIASPPSDFTRTHGLEDPRRRAAKENTNFTKTLENPAPPSAEQGFF